MGFGTYNSETDVITQPQWKTDISSGSNRDLVMDYVAGLVAKACIEAADYYKDFTWSKPWFKLVENYATKVTVPTTGASLDDLNASKMYFALAELTKPGAKYANTTTYEKAITELKNAITGLTAVNNDYSICNRSTVNYYNNEKSECSLVNLSGEIVSPNASGNMNAIGGWYHKATYPNQMWCDSEYMGPALLAQLVAYATKNSSAGIGTVTGTTVDDWKLIAKQFDITWNYLWNSTDQLLYHGFSATPDAIAAHTFTWATGTNGTNKAYWGRAIGWYFLALVDVLENMPDDISDNTYINEQNNLNSRDANIKKRLTSYLKDLAAGIWAQKKDNNLWTNVINEAVGAEHSSYSTTSNALRQNTQNYLEASASAIYIAAYIKAMRLGLLSSDTYKSGIKTAYQSYISNFIKEDNTIINTCASAGLGGGSVDITEEEGDYKSGGKKYRDGTADYYTRGYDVTKVTGYQEGKPLGAFILASTEYERYMKADYAPSFTAANAEIPTAQTVTKGQSVTLHAAAMAKPLAEYKWYSYPATSTRSTTEGTLIPGATSSDLTVTPQANTYYYCEATNSAGSTQTEPVLVTVSEGGSEGTNTATEKKAIISLANVNNTCTDANSIVTVDVSNATYATSSNYCKVVKGQTFTVSSEKTIKKIVINYSEAKYAPEKDGAVTVNTGTFGYNTTTTSSTWTGSATSVTFTDDSNNGNDLRITSIEVTYLDGSSTEASKSTDASASFTYNGSALSFTENVATITLESSQANSSFTVNAAPATGATITTSSANTSISIADNVITITAPAAGSSASYVYTVTAEDSKTTQTYTINVTVKAPLYTVTFNVGENGTCSTPSLTQESQGASITLPSVTPKTGYKFDGWYTAPEGGTQAENPYIPTADITLYAHYTSTASKQVVATFVNPTKTTWTATDNNGFTITGVSTIKSDGSAKLSPGGSITLNIPEGYTVTGFDFTLLCANTTEGSTLSVGDDEISVKDGTHTLHEMNLSSSVTGPTTLTITNSGGKELNIQSIKVYGSNGKSISFTTHPQDAEYVTGATATALTVEAQVNNVTGTETPDYQWYSNGTKSTDGGTPIEGKTDKSYTPDVSTAGTTYYYCKASATVEGEDLEAYSNIATVTVSDPTLTIVTQPVGATYKKDQDGVAKLMVEAETNTGREDFTYQWYKKTTETATGSPISSASATSSEYTPPVDAEGTIYYYCEVKLELESETLTATTNTVAITVNNDQPIYGYKVSKANITAPKINTSMYITTTSDETGNSGDKLVKMTFGGWKWNGGIYKKPGSETETTTDSWKNSETVSGVTVLDGYQYWFPGTQDAKQENKDAETEMYGEIRNGWFESPTRDANGVTTESHPYTLPVRGSFMTFEPTQNGTLTIYILQNGAWNTFDKDTKLDGVSYAKGDIKPGEFRMHAFQVTNQRGLVLEEFSPKYSVTNNQMVQEGYSCSKYLDKDKPSTFDKTSKDVSNWEEFWALEETERQAVHDNWSDAVNTPPENHQAQERFVPCHTEGCG